MTRITRRQFHTSMLGAAAAATLPRFAGANTTRFCVQGRAAPGLHHPTIQRLKSGAMTAVSLGLFYVRARASG
jgi:hypothetical protein